MRLPDANPVPFPANVLMMPDGFTMRIRFFCGSAM
jgi:hypothetical protein